jgi:hypothetical protein
MISNENKCIGVYVTMADALNENITPEILWTENKLQQAIALIAVRKLLLERGRSLIEKDISLLHGILYFLLLL